MRRLITAGMVLWLGLWPGAVLAVQPDEVLSNPVLEQRAREISKGLRCVVCQNQSIDDSNAPLARDLRIIVRERLTAGDTDQQAVDYIVDRYGHFVLLKPPVAANTLVLWYGPALLTLLALVLAVLFLRKRPQHAPTAPEAFSDEEQARLAQILGDNKS